MLEISSKILRCAFVIEHQLCHSHNGYYYIMVLGSNLIVFKPLLFPRSVHRQSGLRHLTCNVSKKRVCEVVRSFFATLRTFLGS